MYIYMVLPGAKVALELAERFNARPNVMLSYVRIGKEFGHYINTYKDKIGKIMLDSGAYSEMAGTTSVDLETYMDYLLAVRELFDHCINLDVDPENYDVRNWNLARLNRAGLNVLPVIHDPYAGEIDSLYDQGYRYVLLGSSWGNDRKQLDFIFERYVHSGKFLGIKFHKLGTATYSGLSSYPYYSADSSGFILKAGFGDLLFWNDYRKPDSNGDCTDEIYCGGLNRGGASGCTHYKEYRYLGELEDYLWRTFEFRIQDVEGPSKATNRWIVNGKYVLDLEKRMTAMHEQEERKDIIEASGEFETANPS